MVICDEISETAFVSQEASVCLLLWEFLGLVGSRQLSSGAGGVAEVLWGLWGHPDPVLIHSVDVGHSGRSPGSLGDTGTKVELIFLYLRPDPVLGGRGSKTFCAVTSQRLVPVRDGFQENSLARGCDTTGRYILRTADISKTSIKSNFDHTKRPCPFSKRSRPRDFGKTLKKNLRLF